MANAETFDPGPSFVENDRPVERLVEMPAWLQTFASQESTRDESDELEAGVDDQPAVAQPIEPQDSHSEDVVLPDWLKDDRSPDDSVENDQPEYESMGEFLASFDDPTDSDTGSFISEDDLPDWLKAFSDESAAPPVARTTQVDPTVSSSSAGVAKPSTAPVRVPPVENVWWSSSDRQALGAGGTLFALLASNANGTLTHASATTGGSSAGTGMPDSSAGARGAFSRSSARGDEESEEPAAQKNSTRLLLLTLVVVALVIVLSFMFFS